MRIFAHRGLLEQYPENSNTALKKALEQDFDIETDLRLTKDEDFVIIHDDNFKRLTGKDISVSSITLNEALKLQYSGSSEKIISLNQYLLLLQTFNTHSTAIHLKADAQNAADLNKIAEYWQQYDLYHQAFIFDLTVESARKLKNLDNKIKIALIISEYKFEPTIYLWDEVKNLSCFDIVWAAEYRTFYNQQLFQEMKKTKEAVYTMSPDVHGALGHPLAYEGYQATWKNLIAWNVDGICTDKPFELLNLTKTI